MLNLISRKAKALYSDEQGADMVEYVLIVAAVALPLLAVIIWFWKDIGAWTGRAWEEIKGNNQMSGGETDPGTLGH